MTSFTIIACSYIYYIMLDWWKQLRQPTNQLILQELALQINNFARVEVNPSKPSFTYHNRACMTFIPSFSLLYPADPLECRQCTGSQDLLFSFSFPCLLIKGNSHGGHQKEISPTHMHHWITNTVFQHKLLQEAWVWYTTIELNRGKMKNKSQWLYKYDDNEHRLTMSNVPTIEVIILPVLAVSSLLHSKSSLSIWCISHLWDHSVSYRGKGPSLRLLVEEPSLTKNLSDLHHLQQNN